MEELMENMTHETVKARLRDLEEEMARARFKEPRAPREKRAPSPRIVLFRGGWTDMQRLAIETAVL